MNHRHRRTLTRLFAHPIQTDIEWSRVEALFHALGAEVAFTHADRLKVKMPAGQETFVTLPKTHQLQEKDDVMRIRRFLEECGVTPKDPEPAPAELPPGKQRFVLMLTHHESSIYHLHVDPADTTKTTLQPHDPWFHRHHLDHKLENTYEGQTAPEVPSYYHEIANHLQDADEILLVGHGSGKADMRHLFVNYLKRRQPETMEKVVGILTVDGLTEPQLLASAREHFGFEAARRA